ncbi:MAG: hypothetical protein IPO94_12405 [Saprospiraceae bacterium]|nr:hypothetical protein [Saprospiraceae bacterium]
MAKNDLDWVQLKGWSPGLVVNYPVKLGKTNPMYYFGLRYLKFSLKEATGLMVEFGVSYRMAIKGVNKYKLKDEFLSK